MPGRLAAPPDEAQDDIQDRFSAASCWCRSPTASRAAASTSTGASMPSSRTWPASPSLSMATASSGNGGSPRQSATSAELIARPRRDRPVPHAAPREHALDDGALAAALTIENRAPIRAPLRARLPSLVPQARRHDASGKGRPRLAGGRAPSADRRRAGCGAPRLGFCAGALRCPHALGQQRLRRLGRPRGDRPARRWRRAVVAGVGRGSASTSSIRRQRTPASSASSRSRTPSTRITARA